MNATAYFQEDEETEQGLVGACVILGVCFLVGTPGNLLVGGHQLEACETAFTYGASHLHLARPQDSFWFAGHYWPVVGSIRVARFLVFGGGCLQRPWCTSSMACMYSSGSSFITIMSVERFPSYQIPCLNRLEEEDKALKTRDF